ncbi:MAG: FAD:protein FMN transferase [Alphaproteobacteria bacterium]|nr:FAD:protein FMN transferase [Alphaproteobacteria bacterium]MDE2340740.1 FAD:protein FMN transferase [Alphaproteobacteria bacterium]
MASPCSVNMETTDAQLALHLGRAVEAEALRIEHKFSRYRVDSALSAINRSAGKPVRVDSETAALLDYATQCFAMSDGMFDISSGVLRKVWRFDGSDQIPAQSDIAVLLEQIGWQKAAWNNPKIALPDGMEIDFGGFGKEYAVDRAMMIATAQSDAALLINFGGDLRVSGPRRGGKRWSALIEQVDTDTHGRAVIELASGALTTSGDSRRFLFKDGVRYGHILNPRTGWPVRDAPRAVTVAAETCIEAGFLSTLAMLKGKGAEAFLRAESVPSWVVR